MLESLLSPKTIAVIGASRTPGKVGHAILANLVEAGFEGEIVPVNPSSEEILGVTCYKSLEAYGGTIDLAVISIPAPMVQEAALDSIKAGAQAIVVITAGYKEIGEEGARLERAPLLFPDTVP